MRIIRTAAKAKSQNFLDFIQNGKDPKALQSEIFNACSNLIDTSFYGEGGEQIWIGILLGNTVQALRLFLSRQEYTYN